MTEHADTLVTHAHLFTMQGQGVGYVADGAVAVKGSRIATVGPTAELTARYQAAETLDGANCAVQGEMSLARNQKRSYQSPLLLTSQFPILLKLIGDVAQPQGF